MKLLITGGSGLIGNEITKQALAKGYSVAWLSREEGRTKQGIQKFKWDVKKRFIDTKALDGVDIIIHLAGENIGSERWSEQRKAEILNSRIEAAETLQTALISIPNKVQAIVCASAIGYYGNRNNNEVCTEQSLPGNGFQSEVTQAWEKALSSLSSANSRLVFIRTGVVLSTQGGALPKMITPIKLGVGFLGSGEQMLSWIHLEDIAAMHIYAAENTIQGIFNGVAPEPLTNKAFTFTLAKVLKKSILIPSVPAFAIKIATGEMAQLVLGGAKVSSDKILRTGFQFKYPTLKAALENLIQEER